MRRPATIAAIVVLLATSCGGDEPPSDASTSLGTVTVFAAASLTEAFGDIGAAFEAAHPGTDVVFSFGASNALVEQVRAGAPADVIATADERTMAELSTASLVDEPQTFATSTLAIAVEPGNPTRITSITDLVRADTTLVICAPEVPCGRLAREVFRKAGVEAHPRSLEANVKAVLAKVGLGEADAGIVYVTDLNGADDVERVDIPAAQNVATSYPVARVRGTRHRDGASAFASFLLSDDGQRTLREHGFAAP